MSSRARVSRGERTTAAEQTEIPNNDNNCVLGRQNWPQLSASSSNRGSTNNQTRNEDSDRINNNNNNDFEQREYG